MAEPPVSQSATDRLDGLTLALVVGEKGVCSDTAIAGAVAVCPFERHRNGWHGFRGIVGSLATTVCRRICAVLPLRRGVLSAKTAIRCDARVLTRDSPDDGMPDHDDGLSGAVQAGACGNAASRRNL